ncbi:hypothetical protein [Mycobacterium seoulense]|uniref:Uncharacterized protein n=1 Tax=Mycobacterium seoulense TaxID=386911 RepID=A0A7I7NXX4_9MYCO|nr:hypothetical protein [Mycobacterium seoulense]MCV7436547.1 hypothetical protein [Mycobacterium seoulense]BBY01527.1 hypothetical protein MSEO_20260 [Mycobacterium seoulense]
MDRGSYGVPTGAIDWIDVTVDVPAPQPCPAAHRPPTSSLSRHSPGRRSGPALFAKENIT